MDEPHTDPQTPTLTAQVQAWHRRMARLARLAALGGLDPSYGVALLRLRAPVEPGIVGSARPLGWRLAVGTGEGVEFASPGLARLEHIDEAIGELELAVARRQQERAGVQ